MDPIFPRTVRRDLQFEHGRAIGISNRWDKGQYCSILTAAGIVGCGIYDLETPDEFDQAIAIVRPALGHRGGLGPGRVRGTARAQTPSSNPSR